MSTDDIKISININTDNAIKSIQKIETQIAKMEQDLKKISSKDINIKVNDDALNKIESIKSIIKSIKEVDLKVKSDFRNEEQSLKRLNDFAKNIFKDIKTNDFQNKIISMSSNLKKLKESTTDIFPSSTSQNLDKAKRDVEFLIQKLRVTNKINIDRTELENVKKFKIDINSNKITLNVDTKEARKNIEEISNKLEEQNRIINLKNSYEDLKKGIVTNESKIKELKAIEKAENNLNKINFDKQEAEKKAIKKSIDEDNKKIASINKQIEAINKQKEAVERLKNKEKERKEIHLTKQANRDEDYALNQLDRTINSLQRLSSLVIDTVSNITKVSLEFDKNMRNVNSIAQLTEDNYKNLIEKVKEFSNDPSIIAGPNDLAKGLYQLISNGFTATDGLEILKVASIGATAGLTDVKTSVETLSGVMNGLNRKTLQDSIELSDDLFQIVDKGVVTYDQLSGSLGKVLSTADSVGVSFKEIGASYITATRNKINVSETETGLNNLILDIVDVNKTDEQKQALKEFGIEMSEEAIRAKGFVGVLEDMYKATGGNTTQMQRLIKEKRSLKLALALSKDGVLAYKEALNDMNNSTGRTNKVLSQQLLSTQNQIDKFYSKVEVLKTEIGDSLRNSLSSVLPLLNEFVDLIRSIPEPLKNIITPTLTVTSAIGLLSVGFLGLRTAWLYFTKSFLFGGSTLLKILGTTGGVVAGLLLIKEIFKDVDKTTNSWKYSLQYMLDTVMYPFSVLAKNLGEVGAYFLGISDKINLSLDVTSSNVLDIVGNLGKIFNLYQSTNQLNSELLQHEKDVNNAKKEYLVLMKKQQDMKIKGLDLTNQEKQAVLKNLSVLADDPSASSEQKRQRIKNAKNYKASLSNEQEQDNIENNSIKNSKLNKEIKELEEKYQKEKNRQINDIYTQKKLDALDAYKIKLKEIIDLQSKNGKIITEKKASESKVGMMAKDIYNLELKRIEKEKKEDKEKQQKEIENLREQLNDKKLEIEGNEYKISRNQLLKSFKQRKEDIKEKTLQDPNFDSKKLYQDNERIFKLEMIKINKKEFEDRKNQEKELKESLKIASNEFQDKRNQSIDSYISRDTKIREFYKSDLKNLDRAFLDNKKKLQSELKKIDKEEKELKDKERKELLEVEQKAYQDIQEFKNKSIIKDNQTKKQQAKEELKRDINEFENKYKQSLEDLREKKVSESKIKKFEGDSKKAIKEFTQIRTIEINKIDFAKGALDQIEKLENEIKKSDKTDIAKNLSLNKTKELNDQKIKKEIDLQNEIQAITNKYLALKNKMTLEDFEKFKEHKKNILQEHKETLEKQKSLEIEYNNEIDNINKENAEKLTNPILKILDDIYPKLSDIFKVILSENKELRNSLLDTFNILVKPISRNENINLISKVIEEEETSTVKIKNKNLLKPTRSSLENNSFLNSFSKEIKEFSDLKQDFTPLNDSIEKYNTLINKSIIETKESKEVNKESVNELSKYQEITKDIFDNILNGVDLEKINMIGLEMAVVGVAKAFSTVGQEIGNLLTGKIRTIEDMEDMMIRLEKSFPDIIISTVGKIREAIKLSQKANIEEQNRIKELKNQIKGDKISSINLSIENIKSENITEEEKSLKIQLKEIEKLNIGKQITINLKKMEISLLKDKKEVIEKTYLLELEENSMLLDLNEKKQKNLESYNRMMISMLEIEREKREALIQSETNREKQLTLIYENEILNINNTVQAVEVAELKKLQAKKSFEKDLFDYRLALKKLENEIETEDQDLATQALNQTKLKIQEIESKGENVELNKIKETQNLVKQLNEIKENSLKKIEALMSKYYDKELENVKRNHKAEYDIIKLNEQVIKDNQRKIDVINYELQKIDQEFEKRFENKNLSKEASREFKLDRDNLLSNNAYTSNLVRTPLSEFERSIESRKEDIESKYTEDGDIKARVESLRYLAVEQNVFYSELSKNTIKGTKDYDNYIKLANQGFKEYKEIIKETIELEKEGQIEKKASQLGIDNLTGELKRLNNENTKLSYDVKTANENINNSLDKVTLKFKDSTNNWITDINDAKVSLYQYSDALRELEKIELGNKVVEQILPTLTKTDTTSASKSNIKPLEVQNIVKNGIKGAILGETESQTITRLTKEDAELERIRINNIKQNSNSVPASNLNLTSQTPKIDYLQKNNPSIFQVQPISTINSTITNNPTPAKQPQKTQGSNSGNPFFDFGFNLFSGVKNFLGFSDGGIANGSKEGFLATLHGRELILNEKQGDNLAYILKNANSKPNFNSSATSINNVIINATDRTDKEISNIISNVIKSNQTKNKLSLN